MKIRINTYSCSLSDFNSNNKNLKDIQGDVGPTVVDVHKKELQKHGYRDLLHWQENTDHIYIGRNMSFYVPGAVKSKWSNSYSVKKYGRDECLQKYEEYLRNSDLMNQLRELEGKVLGCWCAPESCHGDILVKVLKEMINNTNDGSK